VNVLVDLLITYTRIRDVLISCVSIGFYGKGFIGIFVCFMCVIYIALGIVVPK
jgi:hypothetical protein